MMDLYVLKNNIPVPAQSLLEWTSFMESPNRVVNFTQVDSDECVSTVFLGLNHQFASGKLPPILFETLVFGGKYDMHMKRYATWEQAELGHQETIDMMMGVIQR